MKKLLIVLFCLVLVSCNATVKEEEQLPIIATWRSSSSLYFDDGTTLNFNQYKGKRFIVDDSEYTASYAEELAAIIGDVSIAEYIQEKGQYRPREESEFKTINVEGKKVYYYVGTDGKLITAIIKNKKVGLFTSYKTMEIRIKGSSKTEDIIQKAVPYAISAPHLKFDSLNIDDICFIENPDEISVITSDYVSGGEKWAIAKGDILKKSPGFTLAKIGNYTVKYKKDFDIQRVIKRG